MVSDYGPTEFGNVVDKINQVFRLFSRVHIIKVNIFIAPFKVVDYPLICQLFLQDENVLEKVNDSLFDVKVIEFCYHSFLVFEILFILIN